MSDNAPRRHHQRFFYIFALLAMFTMAWFIYHAHTQQQAAPAAPLPEELAGLALTEVVAGARAQRRLGRLHGTAIGFAEAYMVTYGEPGKKLVVWLGISPDAEEALFLYREMDRRMPDTPFFQDRRELTVNDREVIEVSGQGRKHYYWLEGRRNYWLEVEGPQDLDGRAAVEELL